MHRSLFASRSGFACLLGTSALALSMAAGCADVENSSSDQEAVSSTSEALGVAHLITKGAETAVSTVGSDGTMVLTANQDDIPPYEEFPAGSRVIRPGVTLMGYARYNPTTNSIVNSGIVFDPAGWSALWGDPGIARHRANSNRMYITNLAIPSNKFPSSGSIVGPVNPSGLPANMCGAYIGGACIARSSNSGASFSLAAADCVRRTDATCPFGHFYDGTDLETSSAGNVYAAFNDTNRSRIDVYMATSQTGSFARITDPSPSSSLHPRLRIGPGGLYLLVQSGSSLMLTRYGGGSSYTGTWTSPVTVATGITNASVVLSDRSIRLGPQYDLDIGPNEDGVQEVRVAYTILINGKHKVQVNYCTTGATISCSHPGAWDTDSAGGAQWNPNIITGTKANGTRHWSISFYDTRNNSTTNRVELWGGTVSKTTGSSSMSTWRQELSQIPCPDLRGYWGDYDDMSTGPSGMVYRGFSDSNHGACSRDQYHSAPLYSSLAKWTL